MQLFLFGYAINADPKHLPTGLLASEHTAYVRTIVAALKNTGYYDIRPLPTEEAAERALAQGEVLFVINIPANFERSVDRGETPAILVDADATDPSAILAWEDDPGQPPVTRSPIDRPAPDLSPGSLPIRIKDTAPPIGKYQVGTPEFRYWAYSIVMPGA